MNHKIYNGAIVIPLICYLLAYICGWFGVFVGHSFDSLFFFSWPLLILLFLVLLLLNLRIRRAVLLNAVLIVFCIGGGCWGYESRPFLDAFEARLKHEYNNIPEIQGWALEVLKTAPRRDFPTDESQYPNWVRIPHFPKPHIFIINDENMGNNGYVEISWGSAVLGTWGIDIGKPSLPNKGRKWANGVYFFASPRPIGWGS
jgi:hypothetical protein